MTKAKFDYFKLCLPNNSVDIVNSGEFSKTVSRDGQLTQLKYKQKTPFHYEILVDMCHCTTYISFSGKSLLDNYPSLISYNNIEECIHNINMAGICRIHPKAIYESIVTECDVTADIKYDGTIKQLQDTLMLKSSNYTIAKSGKNRFYIQTTYLTQRKRENLVVYDKAKELSLKSNLDFLSSVSNRQKQIDYYSDKIRLELNLRSKDRLKKYFHCESPTLRSVLYSQEDPISAFLKQALSPDIIIDDLIEKHCPRLRELEHILLLCACGFNLKRVENIISRITSKGSSIWTRVKPYREIVERLFHKGINVNVDTDVIELQESLLNMLNKVFGNNPVKTRKTLHSIYEEYQRYPESGISHLIQLYNISYVKLPVLPD